MVLCGKRSQSQNCAIHELLRDRPSQLPSWLADRRKDVPRGKGMNSPAAAYHSIGIFPARQKLAPQQPILNEANAMTSIIHWGFVLQDDVAFRSPASSKRGPRANEEIKRGRRRVLCHHAFVVIVVIVVAFHAPRTPPLSNHAVAAESTCPSPPFDKCYWRWSL
jgi:hypothetical protein